MFLLRDEFIVQDKGVLQVPFLQVNSSHALHLQAGAEVAPGGDVFVDFNVAAHLTQSSHSLLCRQAHISVIGLRGQLLLPVESQNLSYHYLTMQLCESSGTV